MSRMYGSRGGDEETCPQGNAPCPYPNVQGCPLLCGAGRSSESTQAHANAPEQGPHRAQGDGWATYVRSEAHSRGASAIVLAGTRHPARRVARKCAHTASCAVCPALGGHTRTSKR